MKSFVCALVLVAFANVASAQIWYPVVNQNYQVFTDGWNAINQSHASLTGLADYKERAQPLIDDLDNILCESYDDVWGWVNGNPTIANALGGWNTNWASADAAHGAVAALYVKLLNDYDADYGPLASPPGASSSNSAREAAWNAALASAIDDIGDCQSALDICDDLWDDMTFPKSYPELDAEEALQALESCAGGSSGGSGGGC